MRRSTRPEPISAPSSKSSIIEAGCIPRSATNPRSSSKPNSANSKSSERTQPKLCHSNPVSQPRGAAHYEITVTLTSIPYSLCESVLQRLSPKLGDRLEVAIEASVTVISPEHRCAQKSTFRKVSTARRGGKEFVNPQATSGGCLQYEFRFRAES